MVNLLFLNSNKSHILISGGINASTGSDGINTVHGIIKYYIILGVVSVFFYWMAWTCWLIASERQIQRIRLDFSIYEFEPNISDEFYS